MTIVFVFGSNEAGLHAAGAAKTAMEKHGAIWGKSYGHYGKSFAIPTKDDAIEALPINNIHLYVNGFLAYAAGHRKITFRVTRIGCGLAGFKDRDIAPLFRGATKNVEFDLDWQPWIGDYNKYWGTYES
jgi:hypothetical protein